MNAHIPQLEDAIVMFSSGFVPVLHYEPILSLITQELWLVYDSLGVPNNLL